MILAGDVGGTKTILACFERASDGLRLRAEASFASGEHASFQEILDRFLADHDARPEAACFGIAGPVVEGRATTTNLPWPALEEAELRRWLGVERVLLANDLEAAAYGMLALPAADLVALDPEAGPGRPGNAAVIAAGTGLGEAFLVWDGRRYRAVAGEGGHVDFAPRSDEQIELLRFARQELGGRVSVERLLSGPGLHRIYRFARGGEGAEPSWLARRLESEDPSAVVSEVALEGRDPACVRALGLFVSLYGAEAGDLALKTLAVGGVFVAGGIAPCILPALRSGAFLEAFRDKGRFGDLLGTIPVRVATNPRAPLLGAAHRAAGEL
jgi:glucokinase